MNRFVAAILLLLVPFAPSAAAEPARIVSLNPCLDSLLVHLADREQIAALSHYARDADTSTIAGIANSLPITYETAEEVMALEPDLVLASRHSDLATRNALARLNISTELFSEPKTVDESIAQVRRVAVLIGQAPRGEDLAQRIAAAIAEAAPPPGAAPITALLFQRNGFSAGGGTLVHEMLERTGFVNLAARYGYVGWGNMPLELVIAEPPRVLLAGAIRPGMPTWADRVLRHPALRRIELGMKHVAYPDQLIYCGGPVLIQATQTLMAARKAANGEGP